jgi:hypothetical protein
MSGILTDVTTERWMERSQRLARSVGNLAIESKSIEVSTPEDLVVRDILPSQDLNSGSVNGWSGTQEWQQGFATNGSPDAYNEAYTLDSSENLEDKIVGFYGISFLHADIQTHQIRFKGGKNGTQGVRREFNVESAETDEEGRALFLTDSIFGATEDGTIEQYVESANDGGRVVYHGYVAEPVGETIAEESHPPLNQTPAVTR